MKTITKMAHFLTLILAVNVTGSQAFAGNQYLTDKQMSIINLQGLQILDKENLNAFPYEIKESENLESSVVQLLLEESGVESITSRVYELNEKSSFKNIFVFVGSSSGQDSQKNYTLNVVFWNKSSGSMFVLDYDIKGASPAALDLENGPDYELEKLKGVKKDIQQDGAFFPY